jgi:hypothetical protein
VSTVHGLSTEFLGETQHINGQEFMIGGQVGVSLSHLYIAVAQKLSDCVKIDTFHRKITGERVP